MWRNLFVWHIIDLALFNNCTGPRYFMATLNSKMFSDSPTISLGTHNISDTDIKTKLKEIQGDEVDTQFQNILLTLPEPSSAVITKFKVQFSEKNVYSKCLSPW